MWFYSFELLLTIYLFTIYTCTCSCSLWDYTDVVMNYLCGPYTSDAGSGLNHKWLQYFDIVITGRFVFCSLFPSLFCCYYLFSERIRGSRCWTFSSKPSFFHDDNRVGLFEVEPDSGKLLNADIQASKFVKSIHLYGKCFLIPYILYIYLLLWRLEAQDQVVSMQCQFTKFTRYLILFAIFYHCYSNFSDVDNGQMTFCPTCNGENDTWPLNRISIIMFLFLFCIIICAGRIS